MSIRGTIPRGGLEPKASKTFGPHRYFGSSGLPAAKRLFLLLLYMPVWLLQQAVVMAGRTREGYIR